MGSTVQLGGEHLSTPRWYNIPARQVKCKSLILKENPIQPTIGYRGPRCRTPGPCAMRAVAETSSIDATRERPTSPEQVRAPTQRVSGVKVTLGRSPDHDRSLLRNHSPFIRSGCGGVVYAEGTDICASLRGSGVAALCATPSHAPSFHVSRKPTCYLNRHPPASLRSPSASSLNHSSGRPVSLSILNYRAAEPLTSKRRIINVQTSGQEL